MRRFAFDTVFDDGGAVASEPPPMRKRHFSPEELEAVAAASRGNQEPDARRTGSSR